MRYTVTTDQKTFFEQRGFIEFDGLVTEQQLAVLQRCAAGLDNSRRDPEIKKIVYSLLFASIAVDLAKQAKLRFGYDLLYELPLQRSIPMSLQQMSCIRPLACALMICLEGENEGEGEGAEKSRINESFVPFPHKPGNAVFFSPQAMWDMPTLQKCSPQKCLLIAYASPRSMYVYNEDDEYTHALKRLGLGFGDRLTEEHHPLLFRR